MVTRTSCGSSAKPQLLLGNHNFLCVGIKEKGGREGGRFCRTSVVYRTKIALPSMNLQLASRLGFLRLVPAGWGPD